MTSCVIAIFENATARYFQLPIISE